MGSGPHSCRLEISLLIEQVAFGGKGMGRLPNGKVCFVPFVIPGEKVLVRVLKEKSSFAEADLVRVEEASPDRIPAPCPVFGRCGGCHYQHVSYPRQLDIKRRQVADTFKRLGGIADADIREMIPSPAEFHYRNRVTVHARGGRVGFFGAKSRNVVGIKSCPIATESVNQLLGKLVQSRPADGEYPLREPSDFRGFRQINDAAAELLASEVLRMAGEGGGLLVDAYCGAGFFAKRLRSKFRMTIGIEWSVDAVRAARASVQGEEIYLMGDVKTHLMPALAAAPADQTTVILDPPAEGVAPEALKILTERRPAKILYVSCDPATLARDIKALGAEYVLDHAVPVDMFPQTAEIETAVLLRLR